MESDKEAAWECFFAGDLVGVECEQEGSFILETLYLQLNTEIPPNTIQASLRKKTVYKSNKTTPIRVDFWWIGLIFLKLSYCDQLIRKIGKLVNEI